MSAPQYAYSGSSTRNPFRYALALWRFMRSKTDDDVISGVAIIELGFARSRFGRKLARWEETIQYLEETHNLDKSLVEKGASRPILLEELECLPYGTLGQVFAEHCHNRGLNPNLVDVPLEDETDWLLSHLFRTHDIWHGDDRLGQ